MLHYGPAHRSPGYLATLTGSAGRRPAPAERTHAIGAAANEANFTKKLLQLT